MRLFVNVIEHADQQADEAVESHVQLLALLDFFIRLHGYTRLAAYVHRRVVEKQVGLRRKLNLYALRVFHLALMRRSLPE